MPLTTRFPFTQDNCTDGQSAVFYQPLDQYDRAQGVQACLNKGDFSWINDNGQTMGNSDSMIAGSPVPRPMRNFPETITPGMKKRMNRGHLLANTLGGSGTDRRNLVSLYGTPNRSQMRKVENEVARMVEAGDTVYYEVTAHYTGRNGAPDYLTIKWLNMDTGEVPLDPITIWNTPSGLQP
ncbi:DNA/RNA non-specific endonuclease [Streptomyces sp. KM273126]|uniref:DNA/RNA non-specific endonuclease n=1 Tax=Streptomyces sp. KM273126 TaxID=2545247 RepID=UPI00140527FB|nr:DNA/RNA non-specific endonuclease [Streptomyces sp. KM273126]MBA2805980.1 DNA/RNA non-specific endonuclease [Streptomyces sp. KM273126]